MLNPAVAGEVEHRRFAEVAVIQVNFCHHDLISFGFRHGDDFAIRIDDAAFAEQVEAILITGFCDTDNEGGVLISAGLQSQAVVEGAFLDGFIGLL